jgi:hypothetical protein
VKWSPRPPDPLRLFIVRRTGSSGACGGTVGNPAAGHAAIRFD